jgi:hypothetical protein
LKNIKKKWEVEEGIGAMGNLAILYEGQGKYDKAEQLGQTCFEIWSLAFRGHRQKNTFDNEYSCLIQKQL